jgi:hypothetical protein
MEHRGFHLFISPVGDFFIFWLQRERHLTS